ERELVRQLPPSFSDGLMGKNGRSLGALSKLPVFDALDPRKTRESIVHHFENGWQARQANFYDTAQDISVLLPFAEGGTGD
ncbi:hypothetical protein, partial [Pectobacterium brasiliense]|uniref:hypothetical protein n=1 Tax=Pectobacterium brasiliense TaxID=180957 RepID=UPI001968B96E